MFKIKNQEASIIINVVFESYINFKPSTNLSAEEKLHLIINDTLLDNYIPLRCISTDNRQIMYLDEKLEEFIKNKSKVLVVLGDSGSGKSTFCSNISKKLIDRYLTNNNSWHPFPIRLGINKQSVMNGSLIEDELKRFGVSDSKINELRKSNKFIFILDGYDELATKDNIFATNRLLEWNSKFIITSRSQHFASDSELSLVFSSIDPIYHFHEHNNDHTVRIMPFDHTQIHSYIKKHVTIDNQNETNADILLHKINEIYNLKELSTNPLCLKLILNILIPDILDYNHKSIINKATLYENIFNTWFDHQCARFKSHIEIDAFFQFAQELAFELYRLDLAEIIVEKKNIFIDYTSEAKTLADQLFYSDKPDIVQARNGCPLQRISDNGFSFLHKSFQEFCVARKFSKDIQKREYSHFGQKEISDSIAEFLVEITDDQSLYAEIFNYLKKPCKYKYLAANTVRILKMLNYNFNNLDLSVTDLSYTDFSDIQMPNSSFNNSILKNAILSKANLEGASFVGADFTGVKLEGCNPITNFAINSNGDKIVTIDKLCNCEVWLTKNRFLLRSFSIEGITTALWLKGKSIFICGKSNGNLLMVDCINNKIIEHNTSSTNPIVSINEKLLTSGLICITGVGEVYQIELSSDIKSTKIFDINNSIKRGVLHQNESLLFLSTDNKIYLLDINHCKVINKFDSFGHLFTYNSKNNSILHLQRSKISENHINDQKSFFYGGLITKQTTSIVERSIDSNRQKAVASLVSSEAREHSDSYPDRSIAITGIFDMPLKVNGDKISAYTYTYKLYYDGEEDLREDSSSASVTVWKDQQVISDVNVYNTDWHGTSEWSEPMNDLDINSVYYPGFLKERKLIDFSFDNSIMAHSTDEGFILLSRLDTIPGKNPDMIPIIKHELICKNANFTNATNLSLENIEYIKQRGGDL